MYIIDDERVCCLRFKSHNDFHNVVYDVVSLQLVIRTSTRTRLLDWTVRTKRKLCWLVSVLILHFINGIMKRKRILLSSLWFNGFDGLKIEQMKKMFTLPGKRHLKMIMKQVSKDATVSRNWGGCIRLI